MKMKDFYFTLLSDSSLNTFSDNKQSEFTVRLGHPIHIEEESWENITEMCSNYIVCDKLSYSFQLAIMCHLTT